MTPLFVAVPSYKGISDDEAKELVGANELEQAGYPCGVAVMRGMAHLDLARAELQALYHKNKPYPLLLWQDDDVMTEAASLVRMLRILEKRKDVDVLVAPYKLRFTGERGAPVGGHFYSVSAFDLVPDLDGICPVAWTGLGSVLCRRAVVDKLYEHFPQLCFPSESASNTQACAVFNSVVVDAKQYDPSRSDRMFFGDDRAWSHRLHEIGVKIWAYLDARTIHRDLEGCLGVDLRGRQPEILGPDGKPLGKA